MMQPAIHPAYRRQRGIVMLIVLLAIMLLAGLIFYVFNIGRNVQNRQVTQNAADASAQAGAGYVARTFNTVSMNNVAIARMLASVNVMDSFPLATAFTLEDQDAFLHAAESQLRRGTPNWWVQDALTLMAVELDREVQMLDELDRLFNRSNYDVAEMTFYDGPDGRGQLWRAMESLDAYSETSMLSLGELAQVTAISAARANMEASDPRGTGLLLPVLPEVPWVRGHFNDFERPVRQGLLPEAVDDPVVNRGPFDAVFGWRIPDWETQGYWTGGGAVESSGASSWSRGNRDRRGRFVVTQRDVRAYRTYGTQSHQLRVVRARDDRAVPYSRFGERVSQLANIKLSYVWPGVPMIRMVREPIWITDYNTAANIAEEGTPRIFETAYIRLVFERVETDGMDMAVLVDRDVIRARRYRPSPPGMSPEQRIGNHIWHDELVVSYPIGDEGQRINFVYDNYFIFMGVNIGEPVPVRNPNNFASRSDLPAPIDFDHSIMMPDDITREQFLTFLGVARHTNDASMWPTAFNRQPYDNMVGLAQAHVFNNHSWDLWTQMWHVQLEPVMHFPLWLQTLENGIGRASGVPMMMSADEMAELSRYLHSIEPMTPMMLRH